MGQKTKGQMAAPPSSKGGGGGQVIAKKPKGKGGGGARPKMAGGARMSSLGAAEAQAQPAKEMMELRKHLDGRLGAVEGKIEENKALISELTEGANAFLDDFEAAQLGEGVTQPAGSPQGYQLQDIYAQPQAEEQTGTLSGQPQEPKQYEDAGVISKGGKEVGSEPQLFDFSNISFDLGRSK